MDRTDAMILAMIFITAGMVYWFGYVQGFEAGVNHANNGRNTAAVDIVGRGAIR